MSDDNLKIEIDQLKKYIFSDDQRLVKAARERLGVIGGDEVVDFLIPLLESDDPGLRDTAAQALSDIKDSRAVEPLIAAILKDVGNEDNDTLVFALEFLDCSLKLKEIFQILLYGAYMSKLSAYNILSDQVFDFSEQDVEDIKAMWEDCKAHPEKCPDYDREDVRIMIQDSVDGFAGHVS